MNTETTPAVARQVERRVGRRCANCVEWEPQEATHGIGECTAADCDVYNAMTVICTEHHSGRLVLLTTSNHCCARHELSGATAETAPTGAEGCSPQPVEARPVLIGSVVEADCAELRDIAEWFDRQGKKPNGDFLRALAHRHEILFGAYSTAMRRSGGEG